MQDSAVAGCPDLIVSIAGRTWIRHADDGAFTIGRDQPPSDLSITHPAVSRLHVRVIPGPQWQLIDYESLNGIYVGGARVKHTAMITDGMTVHLANPDGIAITFGYVHPEDVTAPAPSTPARAVAQPAAPETTRYGQATAQLRDVISDIMAVPAPGEPRFTRTALRLLQRLDHLRAEFTDLAADDDPREARAFLTCVEAMYDGLLIRMSVCT